MSIHHPELHEYVSQLNTDLRIAIVASEFNTEVMNQLVTKNVAYFHQAGFKYVDVYYVPGAFEIPHLTRQILDSGLHQLVLTLGCVVRGETPHFDYICTQVSRGIMELGINFDVPVLFGVLTCDTLEQAQSRANENYAIYGLNALVQYGITQQNLAQQKECLMQDVQNLLGEGVVE